MFSFKEPWSKFLIVLNVCWNWYDFPVKIKPVLILFSFLIFVGQSISVCQAYTLGQVPGNWVGFHHYENISDDAGANPRTDVHYLLVDNQYRITSNDTEEYRHLAYQILSHAGVQKYSEIEFEYDPTYQELDIHEIKIIRGKKIIDGIQISEFKTIQREQELDRKIFDGRQTTVGFLSDIRQGDIIEFAYTISGQNPALNNHYSETFKTEWSLPVSQFRFRLLWERAGELFYRMHGNDTQPEVLQTDQGFEYLINLDDRQAIEHEDSVPNWFSRGNWIEFSNFSGWEQVVDWALPLYECQEYPDGTWSEFVSEWEKGNSTDPVLQVQEVLRFVQDEVRYLGIEMGVHSLVPHDPSYVLKRRFGDCKDKSLLFLAILRSLGIEAYPALVNTNLKHELDNNLPSVTSFNHVIIQVVIENEIYWFDPTQSYRRGSIASTDPPDFRRALVIKSGTGDLVKIRTPKPMEPQLSVEEKFIFSDTDDSVFLEVKTTYKGNEADVLRYRLARESRVERERQYLNYYAKSYPGIKSVKTLEITDDEVDNEIVHHERYRIPDFKRAYEKEFEAWSITERLSAPHIQNRKMPYSIPYPMFITHNIELEFPSRRKIKTGDLHIRNCSYEFKYKSWKNGRNIFLRYDYSTFADYIASEEINTYIGDVQRMNAVCFFDGETSSIKLNILNYPIICAWFITIIFLGFISVRVFFLKVKTGQESLVGMKGRVRKDITVDSGTLFIHGELWQARSLLNLPIPEGTLVVVERVDGLILFVKPDSTT